MINQYFEELWFSSLEIKVFKAVYSLGTKPASIISKHIWVERTTVYKAILRLVKEWLIYETQKLWIKHFFVPDKEVIKKYVESRLDKYKKLEENYKNVEVELTRLDKTNNSIPKISLFEGISWVKNIYDDILLNTLKNNYISIRLFASNTINNQTIIDNEIKKLSNELSKELQKNKISIETYLWNGIELMENITRTFDVEKIKDLSASNSSINIYLVWNFVYLLIFKDSSIWLKLESPDFVYVLNFLFDNVNFKS